jgi:hypothetical protein
MRIKTGAENNSCFDMNCRRALAGGFNINKLKALAE